MSCGRVYVLNHVRTRQYLDSVDDRGGLMWRKDLTEAQRFSETEARRFVQERVHLIPRSSWRLVDYVTHRSWEVKPLPPTPVEAAMEKQRQRLDHWFEEDYDALPGQEECVSWDG